MTDINGKYVSICVEVLAILKGLQGDHMNYCCFVCEEDSREVRQVRQIARNKLYKHNYQYHARKTSIQNKIFLIRSWILPILLYPVQKRVSQQ